MGHSHLKSVGTSTALYRFRGAKVMRKDAVSNSHASGLPLALRLGGPPGRLDDPRANYSTVPTGLRGGADHSGDLSWSHKEDPQASICSPRPRGDHLAMSTSRRMCGSARGRSCRSRALHPRGCALTSGPSVEWAWAVGPPSSVPVGLGVTVPQNPHRQVSAEAKRPHCTADSGRAATTRHIKKCSLGPPRGP